MWFFNSPEIVFGEEALGYLENLRGQRAALITDPTLVRLGHAARVRAILEGAGFQVLTFSEIEPDPSLETAQVGAQALLEFGPDWIVALGGGSVIDAAKAIWVLYECPGRDPESINPVEWLGLRAKARFAAVPTTSGTGSEATWAIVLTNRSERRKLGLGSREATADLAVLDPSLVMGLPPRLTADTGLDALTHAVEGFTGAWHNDFTDGLCLVAARLVFEYLPRAYRDGSDAEARQKLHNAATIAGLGFGNAMAALAHGMGHSLGAVLHLPHGRAVSLALPYTIEYCLRGEPGSTRYTPLAKFLDLPCADEGQAGRALAAAFRDLQDALASPRTLRACGISHADFERELPILVANALNDSQTLVSTRIPDEPEMTVLFERLYDGAEIDL